MVFRKNLRSLERRWEKISKILGDLPSEQIFYRNIPLGAPDLLEEKNNFFAQYQIKIIIVMRFAEYSRIENSLTKNELGFFIQSGFWLVPFWRG